MNDANTPAIPSSEGSSFPQSGGEPRHRGGVEQDASLDLSSIVSTLLQEKWLILLVAFVVTGAVLGYTYTQTPVYQSSSMVRISQESDAPVSSIIEDESVQQPRDLAGEVGVLRNSLTLAKRVTQKLQKMAGSEETVPFPTLVDPKPQQPASEQKTARRILRKVEFTPIPERNMIEITAESQDPGEASTIANTYAKTYRQFSQEKARESLRAAREFLEERASEQRRTIRRLEQEWASFAKNNQVVELEDGGGRVAEKYNELKARRDELTFRLEREQSQLELLRQQLRNMRSKLDNDLAEQQQVSGIESEIEAVEEKIAEKRATAATYYAANPELEGDTTRIQREFPKLASLIERTRALEARKQELTQRLAGQIPGGRESSGEASIERLTQLRSQIQEKEFLIQQLKSQVSSLDSQIADYDTKLGEIPEQRLEGEQIRRRLEQAQAFQEEIRAELQQTKVAEESKIGYVEFVQKAFVPSVPVRPKTVQNLILGLLLGLGFGVGFAFLKEATNTRLRQPSDIEEKGYSLLGVIPEMTSEIDSRFDGRSFIEVEGQQMSTRLMPLLNPWSAATENYRLIQTNLESYEEDIPETLVVTSAQPEEGKTVTSTNLAITAAMSGKHVLLIDADLRDPSAHKMLGLSRKPGLADMLAETSDSSKPPLGGDGEARDGKLTTETRTFWAKSTPVENLHFIPAGITETVPTNLLDSERLGRLVEAGQMHYDIVLVDTPPMGAASDAVVIGTQTNASTLVVSADGTDERALDSAMKALYGAGMQVSGVILNRFKEQNASQYYIYSYSYYSREEYEEYQNRTHGVYEEV